MPSNKNQHFVPRCYLKPFTLDAAGDAINLFNIAAGRSVQNAPVKSQCARDYFYGKNKQLELALQPIEGAFASLASRIITRRSNIDTTDALVLRRFVLLQYMRTEAAARRAQAISEDLGQAAGMAREEYRTAIGDAMLMAMRLFVQEMAILDDLKVCLIWNRSQTPFVTCDDPAVMTNRWYLERRRARGMSSGLESSGMAMLLPLSPEVLCIFYDGDVYSIPHKNGWAETKHDRDADALNQHQFINCRANVYFRDWNTRQSLSEAFKSSTHARLSRRQQIVHAVFDRSERGRESFRVVDAATAQKHPRRLVGSQTLMARPTVWPRQLRFRERWSVYTDGSAVGYIRRGRIDKRESAVFRKVTASL